MSALNALLTSLAAPNRPEAVLSQRDIIPGREPIRRNQLIGVPIREQTIIPGREPLMRNRVVGMRVSYIPLNADYDDPLRDTGFNGVNSYAARGQPNFRNLSPSRHSRGQVRIPTNLSPRQRQALQNAFQAEGYTTR
jgi:hypothetical protein